jgi:hypothetical protein
MRALFLARLIVCAVALPLLAGCSAVVRENGDYFEAGADPGRFQLDDEACSTKARDYSSYTMRGMDGTGYDQNRVYNDVYGQCMTGRGHASRPYSSNWLPQT